MYINLLVKYVDLSRTLILMYNIFMKEVNLVLYAFTPTAVRARRAHRNTRSVFLP